MEDFNHKFALLTRKERAMKKKEKELEEKIKKLEEQQEKLKEQDQLINNASDFARKNPIKLLENLGVKKERIIDALNGKEFVENPNEIFEKKFEMLMNEIKELKKPTQNEASDEDFEFKKVSDFLKSASDKYHLVKQRGSESLVLDIIEFAKEKGRELTLEQACESAEEYIKKEVIAEYNLAMGQKESTESVKEKKYDDSNEQKSKSMDSSLKDILGEVEIKLDSNTDQNSQVKDHNPTLGLDNAITSNQASQNEQDKFNNLNDSDLLASLAQELAIDIDE